MRSSTSLRSRCGRIRLSAGSAKSKIAGIEAISVKESFDVGQLRLDRAAQYGCLLRDGGAAEEDHAGQQPSEYQTDNRQPQRMRQPDDAAKLIGQGVERHTEQDSGEDQK